MKVLAGAAYIDGLLLAGHYHCLAEAAAHGSRVRNIVLAVLQANRIDAAGIGGRWYAAMVGIGFLPAADDIMGQRCNDVFVEKQLCPQFDLFLFHETFVTGISSPVFSLCQALGRLFSPVPVCRNNSKLLFTRT